MNLQLLAERIAEGADVRRLIGHLSHEAAGRIQHQTAADTEAWLEQVIRVPINLTGESSWDVLELYYTASWLVLLETLHVPRGARLFEIAAGDTVYIPKALDAFSRNGEAKYVTANLNKELTRGFVKKTEGLSIDVEVIEENGGQLGIHYAKETFDVAAFHHALNDIVQTIIAEREGIDTIHANWWEIEPQLLQAVMAYADRGELKEAVYEPFIQLIASSASLIKPGGYLIFDNCTYDGYDQIGYSSAFHSAYISLAREWIAEAGLGLTEVDLPAFDPDWWMVLRKD